MARNFNDMYKEEKHYLVADYIYLVRFPDRCGGQTTVVGTRMRPVFVVNFVEETGLNEFREDWPHITEEMVKECVRYMKENPWDN